MILYDLICDDGHPFEGWFPDSKAFDRQRRKGVVECPSCGSTTVEKALQAPAVATSRKSDAAKAKKHMAVAMSAMQDMRRQVEKNCEHVGDNFAEEARKIHYGEEKKRDIYGQTSADEARELHEEGVEFGVIPWVDLPDS